MWLDKFSNQSTPAGGSTPARAYSPSPRKPAHLNPSLRNGLGLSPARSSSTLDLSLSPASSTLSLPLANRPVNGSSLKQEQKPPPDVPNPSDVLVSILGVRKDGPINQQADKEVEVGEGSIDFGGLALDEYACSTIGGQQPKSEQSTPLSTKSSRHRYTEIRKSITECDEVLQSVEVYLNRFKAELGAVSAEIENLQARSIHLNAQLENRKKVEKLLGPAVEDLSVSPALVCSIADGPIDDQFGKAITEVEARCLTINSKHKELDSSKVADDVRPILEDLKARAAERIRDHLVTHIKSMRSPNINAQVIQQRSFLKRKEIYPFLARNSPTLAEEISQAYVNTMRWYYNSNFVRYRAALEKLQIYSFDQTELIGSDSQMARRGGPGASRGPQQQHDPFSIGRRADILKAKTDTVIPAHLAEDSRSTHYLETIFRNFNQALLDNVSAEYSVATELFSNKSYQQVSRLVNDIFETTFNLGHDLTTALVNNSTDTLGILICIRLNQHFAFETQRRKVPVLDSYINYTNILLWPRFQKIMDLHLESLRKIAASGSRGAVTAFSLVGGSDASKASVAPHYITQRFGQFLLGMLMLSAEAGDDEPVANSLSRLRAEYEGAVTKLAKSAGDPERRKRFIFNNFSLVLTIIGDTQGKMAEEQKEHFGTLIREIRNR